jgi:hypothetical protein
LPSIVVRPCCQEGLAFVRRYRGQVSRPCAVCGDPVFRYEAEFRRWDLMWLALFGFSVVADVVNIRFPYVFPGCS